MKDIVFYQQPVAVGANLLALCVQYVTLSGKALFDSLVNLTFNEDNIEWFNRGCSMNLIQNNSIYENSFWRLQAEPLVEDNDVLK